MEPDVSGSSRRSPGSGVRLPVLLAVLLIGLWVFLRAVPNDPDLRRLVPAWARGGEARTPSRTRTVLPGKDPAIGAVLPLPARPAGGPARPAAASRLVAVVMLGTCSGCGSSRAAALNGLARSATGPAVVGVAEVGGSELAAFRRDQGLTYPVVEDPGGRLHRAFHASFTPRVYLLSAKGELRWLQASEELRADDLVRAARSRLSSC